MSLGHLPVLQIPIYSSLGTPRECARHGLHRRHSEPHCPLHRLAYHPCRACAPSLYDKLIRFRYPNSSVTLTSPGRVYTFTELVILLDDNARTTSVNHHIQS